MKKLFLVEKQYVFNLLNRMTLVDEHSDCIVTNSIGFWRYKLKNINIKDVPYTEQPNEWSLTSVMPVYLGYPNISFLPEKSSIEMLLDERLKARAAKDWAASDRIRDGLTAAGIRVKDRKDGTDWELE